MGFNGWLLISFCLIPLGLLFLLLGVSVLNGGAEISGMSMIVLGIILLSIAGICLIVGLIKYGQQKF
ncbi:MAG TPA: hypothetical protein VMV49_15265 [Candidatus Deferrimicrobium sp.]|nr:hypothetical protein [Candidatus Deferrimicrobium sp.]